MANLPFASYYFSKNVASSVNPYRYDVIDLPSGDKLVKVFGVINFTNQGLTPQLHEFVIYEQAWRERYQIGSPHSNQLVKPTFDQFVLEECQTHRDNVF